MRKLEVAVISDLHLATFASKPKKVLKYLKSIHPATLVLNGDIIDSWRFSRNYFPKSHLKVIRQLIKMMEKGTRIYYITGNHDEFLRKFNQTEIGNLKIVNQLVLDLNGLKTWMIHGDIFDPVIHQSKWLARLGAAGLGLLSVINKSLNHLLEKLGGHEVIIYKNIKKPFSKNKVSPSKLEASVAKTSMSMGYHSVICGHTHLPREKEIRINGHRVHYLNCGDWVENFTAAEYYDKKWHLYHHEGGDDEGQTDEPDLPEGRQLYQSLVKELTFPNII